MRHFTIHHTFDMNRLRLWDKLICWWKATQRSDSFRSYFLSTISFARTLTQNLLDWTAVLLLLNDAHLNRAYETREDNRDVNRNVIKEKKKPCDRITNPNTFSYAVLHEPISLARLRLAPMPCVGFMLVSFISFHLINSNWNASLSDHGSERTLPMKIILNHTSLPAYTIRVCVEHFSSTPSRLTRLQYAIHRNETAEQLHTVFEHLVR